MCNFLIGGKRGQEVPIRAPAIAVRYHSAGRHSPLACPEGHSSVPPLASRLPGDGRTATPIELAGSDYRNCVTESVVCGNVGIRSRRQSRPNPIIPMIAGGREQDHEHARQHESYPRR